MEELVLDLFYKGSVTLIEDAQEVTFMTYEEIKKISEMNHKLIII